MLNLNIGDIKIEVIFEEEIFLERRFAGFLSNNGSSAVLKLKVCKYDNPIFFDYFSPNMVDVHFEDERIVIERMDLKGYLDFNTLNGQVEISTENSFDSFLRVAFSLILPGMDGLAIHASSLVRNEKAYVFPGKSGAGKTTIVRLTPEATLLTDEISIIRRIGTRPLAYGVPFHGDIGIPGENVNAPVTGLFFPIQGKESYIEEIGVKSALQRLMPNIILFGQDQDLMQKAFNLAFELVSAMPCYDLHFLPNSSFWDCIDEQERKG